MPTSKRSYNKPDDAEITKAEFADYLSFNIILDVFSAQAESEFGISFTDEEIAAEADEIVAAELTEGQTREEFLRTE